MARADGGTVTHANTPVPTIRLISCGGRFDTATPHYLSNIVAYGEQIAAG